MPCKFILLFSIFICLTPYYPFEPPTMQEMGRIESRTRKENCLHRDNDDSGRLSAMQANFAFTIMRKNLLNVKNIPNWGTFVLEIF